MGNNIQKSEYYTMHKERLSRFAEAQANDIQQSQQSRCHSLPASSVVFGALQSPPQPLIRTLIKDQNQTQYLKTEQSNLSTLPNEVFPNQQSFTARRSVTCNKVPQQRINLINTSDGKCQKVVYCQPQQHQVVVVNRSPQKRLVSPVSQVILRPTQLLQRGGTPQLPQQQVQQQQQQQQYQHYHPVGQQVQYRKIIMQPTPTFIQSSVQFEKSQSLQSEDNGSRIQQIEPYQQVLQQQQVQTLKPLQPGSIIQVYTSRQSDAIPRFQSPMKKIEDLDSQNQKNNSANSFKFTSSACSSSHVSVREKVDCFENIISRPLTYSQKKLSLDNFITEAQDEEGSSARSSNMSNNTCSSIMITQRSSTEAMVNHKSKEDSVLIKQMIDLQVKPTTDMTETLKQEQNLIPPPSINAFKIPAFIPLIGKILTAGTTSAIASTGLSGKVDDCEHENQKENTNQFKVASVLLPADKQKVAGFDRYRQGSQAISQEISCQDTPQSKQPTNGQMRMDCDLLSPSAPISAPFLLQPNFEQSTQSEEKVMEEPSYQEPSIHPVIKDFDSSNVKRFVLKIDSVKKEITRNTSSPFKNNCDIVITPLKDRINEEGITSKTIQDSGHLIKNSINSRTKEQRMIAAPSLDLGKQPTFSHYADEELVELDSAGGESVRGTLTQQSEKSPFKKSKIKIFHGKLEHIKINETRSSNDLILYKLDEQLNALIPVLIENEYTPLKQQQQLLGETPSSQAETDLSQDSKQTKNSDAYGNGYLAAVAQKKAYQRRSSSSASKRLCERTISVDKIKINSSSSSNNNNNNNNLNGDKIIKSNIQKGIEATDRAKNNAYHQVLKQFSGKMLNKISQSILVPPFGSIPQALHNGTNQMIGGSYSAKKMNSLSTSSTKKLSTSILKR